MSSSSKSCGPHAEDLRGTDYLDLLTRLQGKMPHFQLFRDWKEVLAFMRAGTSRDPKKDRVLLPILAHYRRDQDPRWQSILLEIFMPGLLTLKRRKSHWDHCGEELWQNILVTFFQVIGQLDVVKRECRLVQKIFNDTMNRLHHIYAKSWTQVNNETLMPSDQVEALIGGIEDVSFELVDYQDMMEAQASLLRQHLAAGRIDKQEHHLLVRTRVHQETIRECAGEIGLAYEAARKRRLRAEAKLRRWGEVQ